MSFARYPAYKDSGVAWLGEVPRHWEVLPLKAGFNIVGGSTPKSENETYWDGDIVWVTPSDLSKLDSIAISDSIRKITSEGLASCGTSMVPPESIVLSTRAPIGSLAIAKKELCTNQGCKSLVPREHVVPRFFAHLLSISTAELNIRGRGTTFLELSADELGAFKTGVPPKTEQQAIATFLDTETAKIDGLMTEQRALVALLKEKRQAVISHAVTKGLNPAAPMKDSGVAWLGEVPEHWALKRIKHLVSSFEQGWSPQCEGFPVESENEWGVLKVGCVNGGTFRPEENKTLPAELEPIPALSISSGDLLISRANTRELVGSTAVAKRDYSNLLLCDKLYRARFHKGVCEPTFIGLYLGTNMARSQIELAATGASSSMVNIGQSIILEMELGLPRLVEQQAIVEFLNHQTTQLDTLTQEAQTAIALLQERRTALISAAVTGKMDVRAAVAA